MLIQQYIYGLFLIGYCWLFLIGYSWLSLIGYCYDSEPRVLALFLEIYCVARLAHSLSCLLSPLPPLVRLCVVATNAKYNTTT